MLKLSDNLDLPLDFITERIAFLARTGAGKSGGMRVLFEQIFDAGQFAIFIDPKGDAYGIRGAGIGKGKAVLVMGGDHGDVPLEAAAGKVIAEFLVHERVSTVLDVSDFGKADMIRFVADLCRTLYQRNRDVVHIFIDEADMVAGEKFYDPRCLEAIQLIQNKGRHRGFGVTVATQRSAMINKTVLFASGTLIAMQTTSPKDIAVIREWLEVVSSKEISKEIVAELPLLKTREAIVYSPQLLPEPVRITFNEFQTFDSMRTPKPGEARQQPKSLADIDLSAVQRDMAATIEKVKAEDPRTLKAEVAQLKRDLQKAQTDIPKAIAQVATKVEIKEVPVIRDSQLEKAIKVVESIDKTVENLQGKIEKLLEIRHTFSQGTARIRTFNLDEEKQPKVIVASAGGSSRTFDVSSRPHPKTLQKPVESSQNLKPHVVSNNGDSKISRPQQTLLDTLAMFAGFGVNEVRRSNLAAFAGVSPRSSGFEKNLSVLKNHPDGALVDYLPGSHVALTDSGRTMANEPDHQIATNQDLLNAWRRQISNPQGVLLQILFSIYPDSIGRDELAKQAEVSPLSSGFEKNLSVMRSLGLIDYGPGKTVYATDLLFPF